MNCYLIGAGELEGAKFLRPQANDLVIAVDGGLAHLEGRGIVPDILLGDFDSVPPGSCHSPGDRTEIRSFPPEKNYTDMMLAAETGFDRGYRSFYILGGTGGRMDHTLANIQVVVNLVRRGCRVLLIGRDFVITAIHNGKMAFSGRHKGYFSIYAYSDIAWGVNEIGFKYGLENYTLRSDDPRGISNEFCGQEGIISVEKGTLLICAEGFDGF